MPNTSRGNWFRSALSANFGRSACPDSWLERYGCFASFFAKAISVKKGSEIAAAFKQDGVRGFAIKEFSVRSAERDMFRWCLACKRLQSPYLKSTSVSHPIMDNDNRKNAQSRSTRVLNTLEAANLQLSHGED